MVGVRKGLPATSQVSRAKTPWWSPQCLEAPVTGGILCVDGAIYNFSVCAMFNIILIPRYYNLPTWSAIVALKFSMAMELAVSTNESSSQLNIRSERSKLQGIKFFLQLFSVFA